MMYSRLLLVAVLLTACDEPTNPIFSSTSQARVRFINATTDVAALNFAANGQTTVQNIAFGTPSACQTFNPGAVTIAATPTGSTSSFGTPLNQTLPTNGRFTVVATGSAGTPQFLFLNDARTTPPAGRARLRIINAVPGSTTSDIFLGVPGAPLGTAAATGIGFNTATTFLDVPAGPTQVRFANTGTQNVSFTGDPFTLSTGETATVVVAPGTTLGTFRAFTVQPC